MPAIDEDTFRLTHRAGVIAGKPPPTFRCLL